MFWHYAARIVDSTKDADSQLVELVEVYPSNNAVTINAVKILAESKEELVTWLRKAADDVEKYDVFGG